jgi:transposase
MKRRRYTAEFKKEAAKMIIIDGIAVKEVSEQLGVPEGVLYSWKQKYLDELEQKSPEDAPSPKAMAEELGQLRKELAKQKRMNEILKKTVGYFSNPD